MPKITRIEIISEEGRVYVNTDIKGLEISIQDNERTLKMFIK